MINLTVIRHGLTQNNINGIITGWDNPHLTLKGKIQIRKILQNLPNTVYKIYTSPLSRCIETANIINSKYQINILKDIRLNERSFGSIQGENWSEIDPKGYLRKKDLEFKFDYSIYGGESSQTVLQRVSNFIEDLKVNSTEKNIVIVTSSGIVKSFYVLLESKLVKSIDNASIHHFIIY